MERSESIKEIANALCKFQSEVDKIKKDSKNPYFQSKYASLSNILDVIQAPLLACGLSIMQMPTNENQLQTLIMHVSGEWISSSYTMEPVKKDPQGIGSCITYQRRYALASILCLNIDDDDDGNNASGNNQEAKQPASNSKKIISRDILNDQKVMNKMFEWLYKSESEAKKNNSRFSPTALIEKNYHVTSVETNTICEMYQQYKVNNSL